MKKPIDPNLERFEDSVFSLTGGDDTSGVSYRAPQFEMKETSAAATPGEYHASENHRQRAEATGAPVEPAPGGEEHHHHHHHHHSDSHSHSRHGKHRRHHHHHHHHRHHRLPKGARVIQLLQRWVEDVEQQRGYLLTKTPLMAKRELYKISGHWDHYLDGMFVLGDPDDETKECFALRPMTCPFQYQVYLNRQRSYRDLPMRLGETSTLFRNEDSGEMHGLIRVRQFTISEGHLVLRPDQLEEEFKGCLALAKYCLGTVGLLDKCTFRFSQWDPSNPHNKYEGTAEQWEHAQSTMAKILDDLDVHYSIGIDEAAFYGPKLDIQYKNVFGKEDTLVTIQIDMLLAQRFGMYYIDENGNKALPYIIHRTSLGCYERTLAYLIEEYAGALPTWMMPEQVRFLPITDRAADYCAQQADQLRQQGFRVEVDGRSEKIGKKIREATLEKIPFMLVVGDRDMEAGTVSVRTRTGEDLGAMTLADFSAKLRQIVDTKAKQ